MSSLFLNCLPVSEHRPSATLLFSQSVVECQEPHSRTKEVYICVVKEKNVPIAFWSSLGQILTFFFFFFSRRIESVTFSTDFSQMRLVILDKEHSYNLTRFMRT